MKKLTLKTVGVALAAAAITVVGASAASADEVLMTNLKVPFDFIVGDVRLPAGDYVVREAAGLDVLRNSQRRWAARGPHRHSAEFAESGGRERDRVRESRSGAFPVTHRIVGWQRPRNHPDAFDHGAGNRQSRPRGRNYVNRMAGLSGRRRISTLDGQAHARPALSPARDPHLQSAPLRPRGRHP